MVYQEKTRPVVQHTACWHPAKRPATCEVSRRTPQTVGINHGTYIVIVHALEGVRILLQDVGHE